MDRLAMLLIGLVFGGGIGFVVAAGAGVTFDGHDHGSHTGGGHETHVTSGADHVETHGSPVGLPMDVPAPTLSLDLAPDPVSGWNLHVETENFMFAPRRAGAPHVPGEGHAHVYVDDVKVARLYGPWMHMPTLLPGATVMVTLNANDHRPLARNGQVLTATATIPAD